MSKTETKSNSLSAFQQSQPSVSAILNPPKRPVELADSNPYRLSLQAQRAIGNFFVWSDDTLNVQGRYMEILNGFQQSKGDQKYLSKECESDKDAPTEKLVVSFVTFKVTLAEDGVTRLVEKIPFRDLNIASATRIADAKEFLEQTEISNEANALAREAQDCRQSQRGSGSLVRM